MRKIINVRKSQMELISSRATEVALEFCDWFSFTIRDELELTPTGINFLNELEPYIESTSRPNKWPGTELQDGEAVVKMYRLNSKSLEIIKRKNTLFEFLEPNYPEDICFYRKDKSPWLITISHEKDLYFELSDKEFLYLKNHFNDFDFF